MNGDFRHNMQTHNWEQLFICKNCGELFLINVILKIHIIKPIGDKPNSCNSPIAMHDNAF